MRNNNANRTESTVTLTQNNSPANSADKISSELNTLQDEFLNNMLSLESEVVQIENEENSFESIESDRSAINNSLDFGAVLNRTDV